MSLFSSVLSTTIMVLVIIAGGSTVQAQEVGEEIQVSGTVAYTSKNELDFQPLDPAVDPDIDLFIGDWRESVSFNTHGNLTERAILTPNEGDPLAPANRGAVLKKLNRLSRATLPAGTATVPTILDGEQELFYVVSGTGAVMAAGESHPLRSGRFVLVPAGLEFVIENTGGSLLVMYLASEPIPDGFRPNDRLLIRDANAMPFRDQGYLQAHWSHNGKNMFAVEDGLATLESVAVMTMHEMTVGQPHSINPGMELVWVVVEGRDLELIGKELRWLDPGMAYLSPATGFTPFAHQNPSESKQLKFLFFGWFTEHEVRP